MSRRLYPLLLFLFALPDLVSCHGTRELSAPAGWESAVSWLPADMETLQVFQGDIELPAFDSLNPETLEEYEMLRFFSVTPLYMPEISGDHLAGVRLVLVLEAGRRFGPPDDGSETQSGERLYLYQFAGESADERVPEWLATLGTPQKLSGADIVTSQMDGLSLHFTRTDPRTLLCSDSEDLLQEVLQRRQAPAGARAFPAELPEWRFVDTATPAWGLRHFDRANASRDQSNPIPEGHLQETGRKDFTETDHGAVGLTYSFASGQGSSSSIHYLSNRVDAAMLRLNWGDGHDGVSVTVEDVEPGVARVHLRVEASANPPLMFLLWAFFGHGFYI